MDASAIPQPVLSRRSFLAGISLAGCASALGPLASALAMGTPKQIELGETVTTKNFEFTLEKVSWNDGVYPPDVSGQFQYIKGEENKTTLVISGVFKNTASVAIDLSRNTIAELVVNDSYTFDASVTASITPSKLDGEKLDPFEQAVVYLFAHIPNELVDQFESITLTWAIGNPAQNSYLSSIDSAGAVYELTYTKQEADARAAEENGVPVGGLLDDGLFVQLPEDYPTVQLTGCASRAFTPDMNATIVLSAIHDEELPDDWGAAEPYLAAVGAQFVASIGWESGADVTTEAVSLSDGIDASVVCATANDGSNRVTCVFAPEQPKTYARIEVWQSSVDGAFNEDVPSTVKNGIRRAAEEDRPKAAAGAAASQIAGLSMSVPAGLYEDRGAIDAVRHFSYDGDEGTCHFQVWGETYFGMAWPNPDNPDDAVCLNTFLYDGELSADDPNWPGDYAQRLAAARGGWPIGSRTLEREGFELQQFAIQANVFDGPAVYVLAIARKPGMPPRIVTVRTRMDTTRAWCPAIDELVESIEWASDEYVPNESAPWHGPDWQFPLLSDFTAISTGIDTCSLCNPTYTLMITSVGIAGAAGLFDNGFMAQSMAETVDFSIVSQWWANCFNTTAFVSYLMANQPPQAQRQLQAEFNYSGNGYAGAISFDYVIENEEFMMPLINTTIAYLNIN